MTTQANLSMVPPVNVVKSSMTSRLRHSVRINPPIFLGSKVEEDPLEFLDRVCKVFSSMGVTSTKKAKFASYQLREVF